MKNLLLHILSKAGPEGMEEEKLLLIAWRCDMEAFGQTGRSITGARWYKTETGVSF